MPFPCPCAYTDAQHKGLCYWLYLLQPIPNTSTEV